MPPIASPYSVGSHNRLHRRTKARTAFRRTKSSSSGGVYAALDFTTPLVDFCQNWSASEIKAGRRLVRFWSVQDRHRLMVSCEPISQEEWREGDAVVSCIYREEVDECFITSVDIINLLEKLVGEEFAVMEKNRIRRNLEGLRPTTVSKHRPGVESFFQLIMGFPEPKPRHIEKDVKVFPWSSLDQALCKIMSKYSSEPEDVKPCIRNIDSPKLVYPPSNVSSPLDFAEFPPSSMVGGTGSDTEFQLDGYGYPPNAFDPLEFPTLSGESEISDGLSAWRY
jgi:hypothetical protein